MLLEECGEATQVIGKVLRHGYQTSFSGVNYNNIHDLETELSDVLAVVQIMLLAGDINALASGDATLARRLRCTHYQPTLAELTSGRCRLPKEDF